MFNHPSIVKQLISEQKLRKSKVELFSKFSFSHLFKNKFITKVLQFVTAVLTYLIAFNVVFQARMEKSQLESKLKSHLFSGFTAISIQLVMLIHVGLLLRIYHHQQV